MFEIVNVNDLNLMNITVAKILIMEPQIKYMSQAVCALMIAAYECLTFSFRFFSSIVLAIFWVPFDGVRHRAQRYWTMVLFDSFSLQHNLSFITVTTARLFPSMMTAECLQLHITPLLDAEQWTHTTCCRGYCRVPVTLSLKSAHLGLDLTGKQDQILYKCIYFSELLNMQVQAFILHLIPSWNNRQR